MSHDHEALQLAVASLDFELTPQEQERMQAGLLDCAECAEIAAGHDDLERMLRRLPVRDASPYVRERVLRAALVPPRDRQWPVLLAAAAMLMLLLGVAAAAGAFREAPALPAVTLPSDAPPALGDIDDDAPSDGPDRGSPRPGESPPGSSFAGAPLTPDTLATVVSPRLRVRSEPRVAEDSIKFEPLLDVGDRLLILAGPVVANDYAWYQVSAWRPGDLGSSWPVGWVARGDHDGTPWLSATADPCPRAPVTMATIVTMFPEERVACFADRPLALRALVSGAADERPCSPEPNVACVEGPVWLAGDGGWGAEDDVTRDTPSMGGPRLGVAPGGPVPVGSMPSSGMVDLEGAFDHPAADGCRPGPVGPGARQLDAARARLACRARFVVTDVRADTAYPIAGRTAVTVSPNLRVRSDPGLTSERYELLAEGTSVWVTDGPVVAADYEWFQVIVPNVDAGAGAPRVGWVAASDHGAERWLAKGRPDCPTAGSLDLADLTRLTTGADAVGGGAALGCFGSTTLRLRGTVELRCGLEARPAWDLTPDWLGANAFYQLALGDGDTVVVARPHPSLGVPLACDSLDDAPRTIEAHFDDPAAAACEATPRDGAASSDVLVVAAYWCRTTLVVDRLTPMSVAIPTVPPG